MAQSDPMSDSVSWDGSIISLSESTGAVDPPTTSNTAQSPSSDRATRQSGAAASLDTGRARGVHIPHNASMNLHRSLADPSEASRGRQDAFGDRRPTFASAPIPSVATLAGSLGQSASSNTNTPLAMSAQSRSGSRGRTRNVVGRPIYARATVTRSTSLSSTTSTDGSAESVSYSAPSEQDGGDASALVMPSLHIGGTAHGTVPGAAPSTASNRTADRSSSHSGAGERTLSSAHPKAARMLVLGLSTEDRQTFAKLVSLDAQSGQPAANRRNSPDSLEESSFSFVSSRPEATSRSSSDSRAESIGNAYEALSPPTGVIELYQPAMTRGESVNISQQLRMPYERLEAKISRAYPVTDGFVDLIERADRGLFEGCFYLFSSPPTASEIAAARPVSHLLPLFPVLVLPVSPTGRPQKTYALCHAVQEQLNGAGVRWLPAGVLTGGRGARGLKNIPGGPLFMLPHDLFEQRVPLPDRAAEPVSPISSVDPNRYSPGSVSSSQGMYTGPYTPGSPSFTAISSAPPSSLGTGEGPARREGARSLSASGVPSTRAGSSVSRSDSRRRDQRRRRGREYSSSDSSSGSMSESDSRSQYGSSTSLADLKRLQAILQHPDSPATMRRLAVQTFLEWRDIEIAANGGAGLDSFLSVPQSWGERRFEDDQEGARARSGQSGERIRLDFSKRVAERRRTLQASRQNAIADERAGHEHGAGFNSEACEAEDSTQGAPNTATTTRESTLTASYWTDPTTPRCVQRALPHQTSSSSPTRPDSYFPASGGPWATPPLLSDDQEAASLGSSSSTPTIAAQLLHLSPADPFHLPSLLRLVGLNLRLTFGSATVLPVTSAVCIKEEASASTNGSSWWRTFATVGLVFATGMALGARILAHPPAFLSTSMPLPSLATDWQTWAPSVFIRV